MATYTGLKAILTEFKNRMIKTKVDSATSADSATKATSADSATDSDKVDGYHVGTSYPALVPVTACSLGSSSGYIKLGNGLIVQWGTAVPNGSTNVSISFSISFRKTPNIQLTSLINQENTTDNLIVTGAYTSSFTMKYHNHDKNCSVFWIAIGY